MADQKISDLDAAGAIDGTELVEIVQSGANVQSTVADIVEAIITAEVAADGIIDDAIDAVISTEVAAAGVIDNAIDALVAAGLLTLKAAEVTPLTDSTTGVAGATLVEVGDTSAGDESTEINNNFASLNAQIEALKAAMVAAGTLTEYTP